jgi:threonine dehydratase
VTLRIAVADQPGFLARAAAVIADAGANVIEIHHNRSLLSAPAREAVMEVTLETRGPDHAAQIVARLEQAGYRASLGDQGLP